MYPFFLIFFLLIIRLNLLFLLFIFTKIYLRGGSINRYTRFNKRRLGRRVNPKTERFQRRDFHGSKNRTVLLTKVLKSAR